MIQYDLTVCIGSKMQSKQPIIKCHDTGIKFAVQLVVCRQVSQWREEHDPYKFPDGAIAVLRVHKPDHTKVVVDAEIVDGIVLCDMSKYAQAFTAAGECSAEISIFNADGKRLTSGTFQYIVDAECVCDSDAESEDYIDVMSEQIRAAIDAADRAEAAVAHGPIIQNGTWWLWDSQKGVYVDSGVSAVPTGDIPDKQIEKAVNKYLDENPISPGVKFETDNTLVLKDGILSVNTTNQMDQDNTLPITSAGVFATVGNIEALLKTI